MLKLHSGDRLAAVGKAVERGVLKKADTLGELAEQLELDLVVLKKSLAPQ
ncbi:MAG: hypothetical protein RSG23_07705 [Gordonibacter sp.]